MKKKIKIRIKFANLLVAIILLLAFFVRVYRIDQLLGFYFDQGRDALVIWDFWHKGKFFLIGPTTGIEGVFRGPWYYWLIAPFYLLGRGDPVWPSAFLSLTTVAAVFLSYKVAEKLSGTLAGILAALIGGFSLYLVYASRWLSNPTLMLFISMVFVLSLFKILDGRKWGWLLAAFTAGMAMQFGSAAELFYFPAIIIFSVYLFYKDRQKLPGIKIILWSIVLVLITFAPQILFDLRHQGILRGTISKFLFQEGSFKLSFWEVIKIRLPFYYDMFFSKLFPGMTLAKTTVACLFGLMVILKRKAILKNKYLVTLFILILSPLIGMLFFQGNYGNVYDYYFTGYYLVFVVLFAGVFGLFTRNTPGKILTFVFLALFLSDNLPKVKNYIISGVDGPTTIALGNQKQALGWIYDDAQGKNFNVDVYVPPVIPYAYDYLFLWQGTLRCGESLCGQKLNERVSLLYTLYEADPPHPERLEAWLLRQKEIGRIEKEVRFGGITVQRRERLLY